MNSTPELIRVLRPDAQLSHVPALGCYTLAPNGSIATWQCGGTQPTAAELEQAATRLSALTELKELRTMLDERYALFSRALARRDTVAQTEIQGEIDMILAYTQEVQDAARPA